MRGLGAEYGEGAEADASNEEQPALRMRMTAPCLNGCLEDTISDPPTVA
jgi:hypothetical protein